MFDVENAPAELLVLGGSRLCMGSAVLAAGGAGTFIQIFLANPADSGVIARVISVGFVTASSQTILIGPTQNSAAAIGNSAFIDSRVFGEGTVCGLQGVNTNLTAGVAFFQFTLPNNEFVLFEPPPAISVIGPLGRFSVGGDENEALTVSFIWLERVAQPSELNL